MNFEKLFRALSYAAVFCGFLSLWVSGTFGILGTAVFVGVMLGAWLLEDTKWQVSERLGTVMIVAAMPLYYLLARYQFFSFPTTEAMLPGILARLILTLSAIKLLQKKSDRDWIFLYVMAFFQVLLAAGLSISALYLAAFIAFVLVMVSTIILFEIRKTDRAVREMPNVKVSAEDTRQLGPLQARHLPGVAIFLISHDLHDVFDLADRVTVMKNGKVVGTAKTSDVDHDEVLGMIIAGKCPKGAIPGPGALQASAAA